MTIQADYANAMDVLEALEGTVSFMRAQCKQLEKEQIVVNSAGHGCAYIKLLNFLLGRPHQEVHLMDDAQLAEQLVEIRSLVPGAIVGMKAAIQFGEYRVREQKSKVQNIVPNGGQS